MSMLPKKVSKVNVVYTLPESRLLFRLSLRAC